MAAEDIRSRDPVLTPHLVKPFGRNGLDRTAVPDHGRPARSGRSKVGGPPRPRATWNGNVGYMGARGGWTNDLETEHS